MSVLMRSGNWHYRFNYQRHICSGRCEGCATERQAKAYEKEMRRKAVEIYGVKSVKALIENYRTELSGGVAPEHITLEDVVTCATESTRDGNNRSAWQDFTVFMHDNFPQATDINLLTRQHCEAYIKHLQSFGRYDGSARRPVLLSPASIRKYRSVLAMIINEIKDRTALLENPMAQVKVTVRRDNRFSRQIFTEDELERIYAHAKEKPLIGTLFIVAGATGLTEGDICTLRWSDINWDAKLIQRKRRKTGAELLIPIIPSLEEFLREQPSAGGEFVFPELAEQYLHHRTGLAGAVGRFITECGIQKSVDAGDHKVSVKDLHSMRHVFCYRAGKAGVPLATVQAIVGHMTPEMTRHYMSHASIQDRREAMMRMPDLLNPNGDDAPDARLERLAQEIKALSPDDRNKLMSMI